MVVRKIFFIAFLNILFLACSASDTKDLNLCNKCVIIDNAIYNNTTTTNYTINNVTLSGDILTIKIAASGCSGNSWSATLIDANEVLESFPIQRNIKVHFKNTEACLAFFEKEFVFNIKKLKENKSEIILNLEGWHSQINY